VTHTDVVNVGRVVLAFALSFAIGFERELRGSPAGDRTYALVGTGAAAITAVTLRASPQAVAGAITGVGFIGAGLVFRQGLRDIRGITSAACIFSVAGLGVVAGAGHWVLAVMVWALILIDLEVRNIPILNRLDGRRYHARIRDDMAPPMGMTESGDDAAG
jgi:putative Mg2+ transporter-C (MgtC) family protein